MAIIIRSQGFSVTEAIRAHLMRRFSVALHQFDAGAMRLSVYLKDLNGGDKGGMDKCVLVNIQIPSLEPITVETTSHDLYIAISLGARRTRRALQRALRRHRHLERRVVRQPQLPAAETAAT
jgi:ribosome-associated translation inhibitor RaiA